MSDQQEPLGLTLCIDKPLTWTSFDVVNKIRHKARHLTGRKKIKVGHAGTLDPLASGLVIVCVGRHTKRINEFMDLPKQYTGTIRFGATTPSYDLETEINETFPLPENQEDLIPMSNTFVGEQKQYPPIFSAKRIDGKRAYDLARKGVEVEMKPSMIEIQRFDIDVSEFPDVKFILDCSKGTYVRSLAHDFGKAMHSGAHLIELRRTAIGDFKIEEALSIEAAIAELEEAIELHQKSN